MTRPLSRISFCAVLALGAVAASSTLAQPAATAPKDPVAQVEYRQQQMKRLGAAMKAVNEFVREGKGTAQDVTTAAQTVKEVGGLMKTTLYPQGTAVGVSDSEALPLIWQDMPRFQKITDTMIAEADKLAQVGPAGDKGAIGKQLGALGANCKSCHETFRLKK